jgi:hypothetical protein
MLPLILFGENWSLKRLIFIDIPILFVSTFSIGLFYFISQKEILNDWKKRIVFIPLAIGLGVSLMVNNSRAVWSALFKKESEFVRTPKYGDEKVIQNYYVSEKNAWAFVEILFGVFYLIMFTISIVKTNYMLAILFLLFQFSFFYIGVLSLYSNQKININKNKPTQYDFKSIHTYSSP